MMLYSSVPVSIHRSPSCNAAPGFWSRVATRPATQTPSRDTASAADSSRPSGVPSDRIGESPALRKASNRSVPSTCRPTADEPTITAPSPLTAVASLENRAPRRNAPSPRIETTWYAFPRRSRRHATPSYLPGPVRCDRLAPTTTRPSADTSAARLWNASPGRSPSGVKVATCPDAHAHAAATVPQVRARPLARSRLAIVTPQPSRSAPDPRRGARSTLRSARRP